MTIMSNINVPAVAVLSGVACVVLCENVAVDATVTNKAKEEGVNLLRAEKSAFEMAAGLSRLL